MTNQKADLIGLKIVMIVAVGVVLWQTISPHYMIACYMISTRHKIGQWPHVAIVARM